MNTLAAVAFGATVGCVAGLYDAARWARKTADERKSAVPLQQSRSSASPRCVP